MVLFCSRPSGSQLSFGLGHPNEDCSWCCQRACIPAWGFTTLCYPQRFQGVKYIAWEQLSCQGCWFWPSQKGTWRQGKLPVYSCDGHIWVCHTLSSFVLNLVLPSLMCSNVTKLVYRYVAPEYAMTGHLLVKSDVYSYGVVLLELLTGRRPVEMSQPSGQENLVTWVSNISNLFDLYHSWFLVLFFLINYPSISFQWKRTFWAK